MPSATVSALAPRFPRGMRSVMKPNDGATRSIWPAGVDVPDFPDLTTDLQADVCVIGAGIAGLTCAYLLEKAGRRVVVLEGGPIGDGQTGRTSAHLASAIDDRFTEIESVHGQEASRIQYESHAAAIDTIERIARDEQIDCDFRRVDGFLFPAPGESPQQGRDALRDELAAAHRAGFAGAEMLDRSPLPAWPGPCLRFPRQGRFHPLKYLAGLARAIDRLGARIHCRTMVELAQSPKGKSDPCTVKLMSGHTVSATDVVVATNAPAPLPWMGIYTKQAPYRTYMLGLSVPPGSVPDGLYWDDADAYRYVRLASSRGDGTDDTLIIGGEDHKTGQFPEAGAPFAALEKFAREHFPQVGEVTFRWSGQVNEPADYVAFIGAVQDHTYVVTGDSGMGLTHGTIGGLLITDLLLGRPNPWKDLYDPLRKPTGKLSEFVKENANVAAQYADYVTPGEVSSAEEIRPGSGAVLREGMHKLAVYRDDAGQLHKRSATCTHLGCIVQWNHVERTWDCPCHGSRFAPDGKVIMGPAVSELKNAE